MPPAGAGGTRRSQGDGGEPVDVHVVAAGRREATTDTIRHEASDDVDALGCEAVGGTFIGHHPTEKLHAAGADLVVPTLASVTVNQLLDLLS